MLRVHAQQVQPGMRLALPIRNPGTGLVLLRQGFELDDTTVSRLRKLDIPEVWIEYPGTELIQDFCCPKIVRQQSMLTAMLADLFAHAHADSYAHADYDDYRTAIGGLVNSIRDHPCGAWFLGEVAGRREEDGRHAAQVCVTAVLLGLHLEPYFVTQRKRLESKYARNVTSLGLGAAMHDVGMLLLDPAVRARVDEVADASDPEWRMHVHRGYEMLAGSVSASAVSVVLHHHQCFDGSGFPVVGDHGGPLAGDDIHVYSRVCAVADQFDHRRHRPGGVMVPRVRVLREMLTDGGDPRFDPVVLAALLYVMPAFPVGSVVRLTSGDLAVVVSADPRHPCRPSVQIIAGCDGDSTDLPPA
ncbi:MAG: hypothetical protein KDA25_08305, partial [Phycisphaerales bacterium]|nr:hypothetical protein [Phycisphaerales bacterium]